jgi:phosphoglycolate phosphatase-like HAD superfamily hydrolase
MSKVIVFDFDGVISNSIEECFLVSYWAYHGKTRVDQEFFHVDEVKRKPLFFQYRYLVGAAYEYFFLWEAIDEWISRPASSLISIYLQKKKQGKTPDTERLYDVFFQLRNQIRNHNLSDWIQMNPVYPGIMEILFKVSKKFNLYIASTKDELSIDLILKDNNFSIPHKNIIGKSVSVDKHKQLSIILEKTQKPPNQVFFIDDNLKHLNRVIPLGIHCFLASWGYNNEVSRVDAKKLSIPVVDINKWAEILEST